MYIFIVSDYYNISRFALFAELIYSQTRGERYVQGENVKQILIF